MPTIIIPFSNSHSREMIVYFEPEGNVVTIGPKEEIQIHVVDIFSLEELDLQIATGVDDSGDDHVSIYCSFTKECWKNHERIF
jgi:hypothetical protein